MSKSCIGCAYLYSKDTGYSNYTRMDTWVRCAKDANPNLEAEEPYDWNKKEVSDNWPATNNSRCEHYRKGDGYPVPTELDVDGNTLLTEEAPDDDAALAILLHAGWDEVSAFCYEDEPHSPAGQNNEKLLRLLAAHYGLTFVPPDVFYKEDGTRVVFKPLEEN